jgi:hypothetical protein
MLREIELLGIIAEILIYMLSGDMVVFKIEAICFHGIVAVLHLE